LLSLLRLTPPTKGFPRDDLHKILLGRQRMAKVHSDKEILRTTPNRVHERYRQTDDRQTVRVSKNSGPVLSSLWTNVHEFFGQCRRPFILSDALA